jgi:hypothetical protein
VFQGDTVHDGCELIVVQARKENQKEGASDPEEEEGSNGEEALLCATDSNCTASTDLNIRLVHVYTYKYVNMGIRIGPIRDRILSKYVPLRYTDMYV